MSRVLVTLIVVFVLSAASYGQGIVSLSNQNPKDDKKAAVFKPWDTSELHAKFVPIVESWQAGDPKKSLSLIKQISKSELNKKEKAQLSVLKKTSKELALAHKLLEVSVKRFKVKGLSQLRRLTSKYRDRAPYFLFLALEDEMRGNVLAINDFEPSYTDYLPQSGPVELFKTVDFGLKRQIRANWISEPKNVRQGRYAYRWEDTPTTRTQGLVFPSPPDWRAYKYLCLSLKLAKPKMIRIELNITTNNGGSNFYKIGLETWKGWKDFKIDFRKVASSRTYIKGVPHDWGQVKGIQVITVGGLSDYYLDDMYLLQK